MPTGFEEVIPSRVRLLRRLVKPIVAGQFEIRGKGTSIRLNTNFLRLVQFPGEIIAGPWSVLQFAIRSHTCNGIAQHID